MPELMHKGELMQRSGVLEPCFLVILSNLYFFQKAFYFKTHFKSQ